MPQVYLNYKRKSTVGWSLENILLDFTGGMFSMVQQFIDTANIVGEEFNIVKFLLGLISVCFDLIFMF